MTVDLTTVLAPLLTGFTATGGGRIQRFDYLPWTRHQDQNAWSALPIKAGSETANRSAFSIRHVDHPRRPGDIGGGVSIDRPSVDVMVWWADGEDVTDPDAFRKAVVAAVEAIVRANEKALTGFTYAWVSNSLDGDFLAGAPTGSWSHLAIVTVAADAHEVYA